MTRLTVDQYARLKERLRRQSNGCVYWTGPVESDGYGRYLHRRVHIVFWEYHNGPVPEGMVLAHSCNHKRCVIHVRPKTQKENMEEYSGKTPNTHCPRCGIALTLENTYIPPNRPLDRRCRACRRRRA